MSSLFVDACSLPGGALGFVQLLGLLSAYAYVLFSASKLISDGAELLLLVLSPGLVGGLILPVLGAVPDGAIILFSGMGPSAGVQEQLSVGVGTLAGSSIMLLTLPWAACAWLWRVDLAPGGARALFRGGLTRAHDGVWASLTRTGIQTSGAVRPAAAIMALSALTYLVIQVPALALGGAGGTARSGAAVASGEHWYALAGFVLAAGGFVAYSALSISSASAIQRHEAAIHAARKAAVGKRLMSMVTLLELEHQQQLQHGHGGGGGGSSSSSSDRGMATGLLRGSSTYGGSRVASSAVIKALFDRFDEDKSGALDESEVKGMLKALGVYSGGVAINNIKTHLLLLYRVPRTRVHAATSKR